MWSQMAFAADMALDNLRAAMIAAPRFWTVYKIHQNSSINKDDYKMLRIRKLKSLTPTKGLLINQGAGHVFHL